MTTKPKRKAAIPERPEHYQPPEHYLFDGVFKARPAIEGADRIVYVEASQESPDLQGEIVLANLKACFAGEVPPNSVMS